LRVEAAALEQLRGAASLDDAAFVHDEDLVRVEGGREAMGDDERRRVVRSRFEVDEDRLLDLAIEGGGRLVEDEDGGVFQDDARDGDPLVQLEGGRLGTT